MKNVILSLSMFALFFGMVLTSCDENEKHSIELNKYSITADLKGGAELVGLTTSGEWRVTNVPDWISVNPTSGNSSTEVTVTVTENKESAKRKGSLLFTCGDATKTLEIEQLSVMDLDPFVKLSKNSLQMNTWGEVSKIQLETNRSWNITNIPDWVTIHPISGTGSAEIMITAKESREPEGRHVNITFISGDVKESLSVNQFGLKDITRVPSLPIFSFKEIKYTPISGDCDIKTENLFVNPSIKNKVFLGNLLSHNARSNTNIPEFTGYTFNSTRVSTSAAVGVYSKAYTPSKGEQDAYAKLIIAGKPKQNASFIADNGTTEFYTHKQLYALGMTNLGVKLDEVVSGKSFTEKEMARKYGLIFSFKQILFSLDIDFMDKVVKEDIKEADKAQGVSYVISVDYGKVGLLVVESNTDSRDVKAAINKVISDQSLSSQEANLIEAADICYVYFNDNNEVQVLKGKLDAVNAYKDAILNRTENIYPVSFLLVDYYESFIQTVLFSIKVPQ